MHYIVFLGTYYSLEQVFVANSVCKLIERD